MQRCTVFFFCCCTPLLEAVFSHSISRTGEDLKVCLVILDGLRPAVRLSSCIGIGRPTLDHVQFLPHTPSEDVLYDTPLVGDTLVLLDTLVVGDTLESVRGVHPQSLPPQSHRLESVQSCCCLHWLRWRTGPATGPLELYFARAISLYTVYTSSGYV